VTNLLAYHRGKFEGRKEKIVLWAHNSHLGDARFTDASKRGEMNVGQLMRTQFGLNKTFNIGFSTYRGTVTAAKNWDEAAQCDQVRNGIYGSWEHILHAASDFIHNKDYYLIFRSNNPSVKVDPGLVESMSGVRLERYIGVIYRPDTEKASHYCNSNLTKEFDAIMYLDETHAVQPIDKTEPWEHEKDALQAQTDSDTFPELESGTIIESELLDWRLKTAVKINDIGCEFMKAKDPSRARMKFDKALKYVEYNLKKFQANRELQELRMNILLNLSEANFLLKHWGAVIRDCNLVISHKPTLTNAHILLGRAYESKGDPISAKHHFAMAANQTARHPTQLNTKLMEERR